MLYTVSLWITYFAYGMVCMLISTFSFIPHRHHLSGLIATTVFSKSVTLFPFCKLVNLYQFLDTTYK